MLSSYITEYYFWLFEIIYASKSWDYLSSRLPFEFAQYTMVRPFTAPSPHNTITGEGRL